MKHRRYGKKLGRNHNERQAMFRTQVRSFFTLGGFKTTDAKVKAVRPLIEKIASDIITKPDLISRRFLSKYIQDRHVINDIVTSFKSAFSGQTSNFTLVKRIKFRQGDNSLIVKLFLCKPYTLIKVETKKEKETKLETKTKPVKVATKKTPVKKVKETK